MSAKRTGTAAGDTQERDTSGIKRDDNMGAETTKNELCDGGMCEKDWRCRKLGTQAT